METWTECIIMPDKDFQIETPWVNITCCIGRQNNALYLIAKTTMRKLRKHMKNHAELKSVIRVGVSLVSNLEDKLIFL